MVLMRDPGSGREYLEKPIDRVGELEKKIEVLEKQVSEIVKVMRKYGIRVNIEEVSSGRQIR